MDRPSIELSENSELAFVQAVQFLSDHTDWGGEAILRNAAVSYIRAARNSTPKARKNAKRKIVKGPRYEETSKRGTTDNSGRWSVIVMSQKGAPKVVPVVDKAARTMADVKRLDIAAVPRVGAAKNSWWGVLRDLNTIGTRKGPDLSGANFDKSATEPSVTLTNRISYLLKIDPDVDKEAKRRAAKDIVRKTESVIQRYWDKQ